MRISKQARREAKELLRSCQVEGRLDEARVRGVVAAVAAAKPRGYMAVLSHFARLVRLELARRTGVVESAAALSEAVRDGILADLTRRYGPGLEVAFTEAPALIGGMRVRVGSDVYDGSVHGRLTALEEAF